MLVYQGVSVAWTASYMFGALPVQAVRSDLSEQNEALGEAQDHHRGNGIGAIGKEGHVHATNALKPWKVSSFTWDQGSQWFPYLVRIMPV